MSRGEDVRCFEPSTMGMGMDTGVSAGAGHEEKPRVYGVGEATGGEAKAYSRSKGSVSDISAVISPSFSPASAATIIPNPTDTALNSSVSPALAPAPAPAPDPAPATLCRLVGDPAAVLGLVECV